MAGVPIRIPDGSNGVRGSNGTMFLLQEMPAFSSAFSACFPVRPLDVMSINIRWLSVPPETMSKP